MPRRWGSRTFTSDGCRGGPRSRARTRTRATEGGSFARAVPDSGAGDRRYVEQLPLAPVGAGGDPLHGRADGSPATGSRVGKHRHVIDLETDSAGPAKRGMPRRGTSGEPERFTDVETLHAADRGGFTFAPEVGFHENVHEIDFASLYPRIICEHNVSPETVGCDCGAADEAAATDESAADGTAATDESAADGRLRPTSPPPGRIAFPNSSTRSARLTGFSPPSLEPLISERAEIKRRLETDLLRREAAGLRAESGAIKWVLVSLFRLSGLPKRQVRSDRVPRGDQRLRSGDRPDCQTPARGRGLADRPRHRRQPLGDAAGRRAGAARGRDRRSFRRRPGSRASTTAVTSGCVSCRCATRSGVSAPARVQPRFDARAGEGTRTRARGASAGALTKYFGKRTSGEYKFRGIELRQRSTPAFVGRAARVRRGARPRARSRGGL